MTPHFESVIGFDPDGIRRIYASTWIEARQEARNYIRNRPGTAPLSAWRFVATTPANVMEAASGRDEEGLGTNTSVHRRPQSTYVTWILARRATGCAWLASSHRAMLKRRTKIILILMSQMRDLLWEMVTEPLFWPVMLVLAGTFAYLEVTSWRARCVGQRSAGPLGAIWMHFVTLTAQTGQRQ
jgi:hypothetical protein